MLKLILAPDFYRFLLNTSFVSNGMAKTSVVTMNGGVGGSPQCQTVRCVIRNCSWRYTEDLTGELYPPGMFFCCVPVYSYRRQLDERSEGCCVGRQSLTRLDSNWHSARMQASTPIATQVPVGCSPIAFVCELAQADGGMALCKGLHGRPPVLASLSISAKLSKGIRNHPIR